MQYKRVEDDLKPHNQETIKKVLKFFETSNKCCAIQATGTGKTFLILRLLEIYNDVGKKAIIFAPNREIIKQTKSRMKEFDLNNAIFFTYQKLSRMTNEEIQNIQADLIVCDELHRTGAKTWGKKFEYIVDCNAEAKVFGVTATPLRCADGRDMADEYFDGNRACNISLAEALVREIIPVMPTYVSALYTFDEEYKNMSQKIDDAKNSYEDKSKLHKELMIAKHQLEKANGVPVIIKKYIANYNGKYIVFCKDKKHLYKMKNIVIGWFREAGYLGKVFSYPYYSDCAKVRENLNLFISNNKKGLKLLFVIDKLNEGLHLNQIDGCILLRTTVSNIIYYQQIGRAIDAGSTDSRIILDLVSNFNNLKSFNLKNDLQEEIEKRKSGSYSGCTVDFDINKFTVIDCTQECIDLFKKIENELKDSWWEKYDYYVEITSHKRTLSSKDRVKLKSWIGDNKRRYLNETLEDTKINALRKIDFDFSKNYHSFEWEEYYDAVNKYLILHPDININQIPRDEIFKQYKIGHWLHRQRMKYKNKLLDQNKINALGNKGFVWDPMINSYINHFTELIKFMIEHEHCPSRKENKSLYYFASDIRKKYKNGKLPKNQIKQLNEVGFIWDVLEYEWNKKFLLCKEYKEQFGKIPETNVVYKDERLGWWINTQKQNLKTKSISENRIKLLKELGLDVEKYLVA